MITCKYLIVIVNEPGLRYNLTHGTCKLVQLTPLCPIETQNTRMRCSDNSRALKKKAIFKNIR
jgi:hypothetical protein